MKRIAIIHPWFPRYRLEFFELLVREARKHNVDVRIFHGEPPPEWKSRGDSVSTEFATKLPTKFIKLGSKTLSHKNLEPVLAHGSFDAYVVEHAIRSLETYSLMYKYPKKVAFWGHGRTYTEKVSAPQEWLKMRMLNRARWYFAYTAGGARAVRKAGVSANKISIVQNSIDSNSLRAAIAEVSDKEVTAFKEMHQVDGPCALFVGGLDKSKRINFLLAAAEITATAVPGFKLLIGGDGDDRRIVEEAASRCPWVEYLGPITGKGKAVALKSADVLSMPGRVGLVAVDSFASRRPIVTTRWNYHAPEFEYLKDGFNAVIAENSVQDYATALVSSLTDHRRLHVLRNGCDASSSAYTVETMVDNFLSGITSMLGISPSK